MAEPVADKLQIYRTWGPGWFYAVSTLSALLVSGLALTILLASMRLQTLSDPSISMTDPAYFALWYMPGISMSFAIPAIAFFAFPLTNWLIIHPARLNYVMPYFCVLNFGWVIIAGVGFNSLPSTYHIAVDGQSLFGLAFGGGLTGLLTMMILSLREKLAQRAIHKVF